MPAPQTLWSQDAALRATHFAARAHNHQRYPGTELPYLFHLHMVSMELMAALAGEGIQRDGTLAVCCALLHDVVEDTPVTVDDVAAEFGQSVAHGVSALTKDAALDKAEAMTDSLDRIRQQPHEVWMVKLADRITNLQTPPPHWSQAKALSYRDEAEEILEALAAASPFLAARLAHKIAHYPGGSD